MWGLNVTGCVYAWDCKGIFFFALSTGNSTDTFNVCWFEQGFLRVISQPSFFGRRREVVAIRSQSIPRYDSNGMVPSSRIRDLQENVADHDPLISMCLKNSIITHHFISQNKGDMIWEGCHCWWFRNPAPVDVVYPIIYKVLIFQYIPGGCLGFLNQQQYHTVQITSALLWFSFQIFCPKKQCVVYCFYLDPPAGVPLMDGSWGENGAVISKLSFFFHKKNTQIGGCW